MENLPIKDAARELRMLRRELEASQAEVRRQAELLAEAGRSSAIADEERLERFRELAKMAELVLREQQDLARETEAKAWLRDLVTHLIGRPFWWSLLPANRRRRHEDNALRRARIFDAQDYLAIHPDVKASGMDPLRHYLNHGIDERRDRSISPGR